MSDESSEPTAASAELGENDVLKKEPVDPNADYGQNEEILDPFLVVLPRPHRRRLLENVLLGAPFPNPDAGTEFDDRHFRNIEQSGALDLPPGFLEKAQRLAVFLWRKNARAYCATELITDFILGDSIRFKAQDPKVQTLLDLHWKLNEWPDKMQERIRSMSLFGEQLYPVFVSDKSGMVRVSSISPFQIVALKRDKEDAETLTQVRTSLPDGSGKKDPEDANRERGKVYTLIRITEDGSLVDDQGETAGLAFYFAVNRLSGGTRGSPDMLSAIDWLEGLDTFLFSVMERAEITNELVWDIEYKGAKETEIRAKVADFTRSLRSGGVIGHNEGMSISVKVPNLAASDSDKVAKLILREIQAAMRLAGLFFGDAEDLTRASASELSMPVAKMIQSRQNFWRRLLSKIFDFQIQSAKTAGKLDKDASEVFEIDMAQVFLRDLTSVTTALVPLTAALEIAIGKQWVSSDESRIIFRTVLEQITRLPDVDDLEGMLEESLPPELKRVAASIGAIWTELKKKMDEGETDDGSGESTGADAAAN
jgi:hypothetical protein